MVKIESAASILGFRFAGLSEEEIENEIISFLIEKADRIILPGLRGDIDGLERSRDGTWRYCPMFDGEPDGTEHSFFPDEFRNEYYRKEPYLMEEGESGDEFRDLIRSYSMWEKRGLSDAEARELLCKLVSDAKKRKGAISEIYWKISGEFGESDLRLADAHVYFFKKREN